MEGANLRYRLISAIEDVIAIEPKGTDWVYPALQ
jgi:hypothetical protein